MTIYGLSQSNGKERLLEVERADTGLLMHVHDRPEVSQEEILVPAGEVIAALTGEPAVPKTIEGTSPGHGTKKLLDIEVRRNEVLLWVRPESGGGRDIAVGLDDLQDAVEASA